MAKTPKRRTPAPRQESLADRARREELATVRRAARMEQQIVREAARLRRLVAKREVATIQLAEFFDARVKEFRSSLKPERDS